MGNNEDRDRHIKNVRDHRNSIRERMNGGSGKFETEAWRIDTRWSIKKDNTVECHRVIHFDGYGRVVIVDHCFHSMVEDTTLVRRGGRIIIPVHVEVFEEPMGDVFHGKGKNGTKISILEIGMGHSLNGDMSVDGRPGNETRGA